MPLRNYCPRFLNFPALVVGSLTPDLGYYMHNWIWSTTGHSFLGSLSFDLPAGFILLTLFYLNVRSVARLLPYPHREACSAIVPSVVLPSLRAIFVAAISILMGAWTHIIWDGFTHGNGWCVRKFAAVTPTLFTLGNYDVTIWHILQHASTALGLVLLFLAFNRYAHSKRFLKHKSILSGKIKLCVWFLLLILPAVIALSKNLQILKPPFSFPHLDIFSFNVTVAYICYFLPLLCVTGVFVSLLEYIFQTSLKASLDSPTTSSVVPAKGIRIQVPAATPASAELLPLPVEPPVRPVLSDI